MNIVEAYAKKLSISEKVYAKEHGGRALPDMKKVAIARVLANTSAFLNEAFENSNGTQLASMKTFKKFCLDLTTVALPNLIANDLVIVYPMKSRTGFIQYLQFTAGSNKGGVKQGDVFNDVFHLGKMDENRVNYTAAAVTDPFVGDGVKTQFKLAWTPVVEVKRVLVGGEEVEFTFADGVVTLATAPGEGVDVRVAYLYDNVVIPQNDLPILNAHMEGISLEAKARRIAVYYSQMAAFQAKTEMGIDLGEILATQACGELSYQIDTEIVNLLTNNATYFADLKWNKTRPLGVNIRDHYESFAEMIQKASQHIYDATQKYRANYLIVASDLIPVLTFVTGFKATDKIGVGPYYAGALNGVKVYVSPVLTPGTYVAGFNGDDMVTSAAVFAPYMAIVPTQLLGYADGSMSQGFSTLYDVKLLNTALIVKGKVVEEPQDIHIAG